MAYPGSVAPHLSLSPGWTVAEPFSEQGGIVAVAAGAGLGTTPQTVLVSRDIPAGARVFLEKIFPRVIDQAAYDQMIFRLRLNGAWLAPWDAISGEQISEEFGIDIDHEFGPGRLEIVAANISGTGLPGASPDALAIRCIARFKGLKLREKSKQVGVM